MPQLDPTVFAPQLVWLAITFIALYVILSKFALPKIGGIIAERKSRIDDLAQAAAKLRDDAEKALEAYEVRLLMRVVKLSRLPSRRVTQLMKPSRRKRLNWTPSLRLISGRLKSVWPIHVMKLCNKCKSRRLISQAILLRRQLVKKCQRNLFKRLCIQCKLKQTQL